MCVKHLARFAAPGKLSNKNSSSSIMAALLDALSQVIDRIYVTISKSYLFGSAVSYLVTNAEIIQNLCERGCKIEPRM